MRTTGKDLTNSGNPYLEREVKFSNMEQVKDRVMRVAQAKYGSNGIEELRKVFLDIDRNGNGFVEANEFKYCMRVWGVDFTEEEIT